MNIFVELRIILQEMWKCTYIETSAKNNHNIDQVFEEILQLEQKRSLFLGPGEEKKENSKKKKLCRLL